MIVRVGFLDKDENYIARLANYYSAHANETVQFEIYLFTKEEALRKQLSRGGRMDLLVAERHSGSGLCGGNGGTGEKYGLLHTETECVQRFL